jgi:hypothetical protein
MTSPFSSSVHVQGAVRLLADRSEIHSQGPQPMEQMDVASCFKGNRFHYRPSQDKARRKLWLYPVVPFYIDIFLEGRDDDRRDDRSPAVRYIASQAWNRGLRPTSRGIS